MFGICIAIKYKVKYRNKYSKQFKEYYDEEPKFETNTIRWTKTMDGGRLIEIIADILKEEHIFEVYIDICYQNEIKISCFNQNNGETEDIWIRWEEKI